jgi:phosphatidylserine/phosphatidylglycerophosphate/cardiolipin synthase-like enzyme
MSQRIAIVNVVFAPSQPILDALKRAVQRGASVLIITNTTDATNAATKLHFTEKVTIEIAV